MEGEKRFEHEKGAYKKIEKTQLERDEEIMDCMKDITIVFVNYFMKDDILRAVTSVVSDIAQCPYDVQITVADNVHDKDGIKEALGREFP